MVWRVFLLFGDLCYFLQNARIFHAWKDQTDWGNRETSAVNCGDECLEHRHQPNYSCVAAYVFRPCVGAPFGDILSLGIFIYFYFGKSGDILSFGPSL